MKDIYSLDEDWLKTLYTYVPKSYRFRELDSMFPKRYFLYNYSVYPGDYPQTEKFQKVIDMCCADGGGTVVVPRGVYYISGIRLHSNITLKLEEGAILRGTTNLKDYDYFKKDKKVKEEIKKYADLDDYENPFSPRNRAIIQMIDAKNVKIIGSVGSYIEGLNCYDKNGEDGFRGPHAISIYNCRNVTLEGYTVSDSGNCSHSIRESADVTISKVIVYGGNIGFEFKNSYLVDIRESSVRSSCDCIKGCNNYSFTIESCDFSSSTSAFCFGGSDITISKCIYDHLSHFCDRREMTQKQKASSAPYDISCNRIGGAFFRYYSDGKKKPLKPAGNILVKLCTMDVSCVLDIDFRDREYCKKYMLKDITFDSCIFNKISKPMKVRGDNKNKISVTFKRIVYTGREAYIDCPIIDIQDFSVLSFESFRIMDFSKRFIVKRSDGRVLFIENENDKLNLKNLGVEIDAVNKLGDLGFKVECHDPIPNEAIVLKEKETAIIEAEYIN